MGNAAETIQAAIDKLESDRAATSDWEFNPRFESIDSPSKWIADVLPENGERIMRWHRTIDAQLAILRNALIDYYSYGTRIIADTLDLARAILGEDS